MKGFKLAEFSFKPMVVVAALALMLGAPGSKTALADDDDDHDHHGGDIILEVSDEGGLMVGEVDHGHFHSDPLHARFFHFDSFESIYEADVGFDSDTGLFDPDSSIGFNFTTNLRAWNGSSFSMLSPDSEETLTVTWRNLDAGDPSATSGEGFVPGFEIDVRSTGRFHEHLDFIVNDAGEDSLYLASLELFSTDSDLAATERAGEFGTTPLWMLLGYEGTFDHHHPDVEAAMSYVRTSIIPEPASGALLLGLAGLAAMRRRGSRA